MIDDTIELLTKMMIEEDFNLKKENKEKLITMSKTQLYQFCIKLAKVIKKAEEM